MVLLISSWGWTLWHRSNSSIFFFFNDTATTEIYTLSLHDALPIWESAADRDRGSKRRAGAHLLRDFQRLSRNKHQHCADDSAARGVQARRSGDEGGHERSLEHGQIGRAHV